MYSLDSDSTYISTIFPILSLLYAKGYEMSKDSAEDRSKYLVQNIKTKLTKSIASNKYMRLVFALY